MYLASNNYFSYPRGQRGYTIPISLGPSSFLKQRRQKSSRSAFTPQITSRTSGILSTSVQA